MSKTHLIKTNRIYLSKFPSLQLENVMQNVTEIFNEFVKGIILFDSEEPYNLKP